MRHLLLLNLFLCIPLSLCCQISTGNNTFPNNGSVGIGTTSPVTKLEVKTNNNPAIRVKSTKRSASSGEYLQMSVADCNGCFTPNSKAGDVVLLGAAGIKDFRISKPWTTGKIIFSTDAWGNDIERLVITGSGNVGIGKSDPTDKLEVNGRIHAKSVKVDLDNWPDYVFEKGYNLKSLEETEQYILKNGHLENLPSRKEVVQEGLNLGDINKALTEKVEELTLHLIDKNKEIKEMQAQMLKVFDKLSELERNESSLKIQKI